jgi:predicted Zn-dependent peptidase
MKKRDKVINKTILPNGVKIITKKIPHVRSVSMGVWVNVGARDETDDQSGLSHFIEHMIFRGTARRSAYEIAKAFDAVGGHTNAFTSMEHTCYYAKVLDTHLETMVEILSDIFLNSVFDPQEVERERAVIFQEIGMVEDSPEEFVHQAASQNFWGDHPLARSILGTRENIEKFQPETVKAFFNQFYHPKRILIAAAGNVDHHKIIDLVGPAFGSICNGQTLPKRYRPLIKPVNQTLHRDLEQAHICLSTLGLAVTDPQRFAFSLMNTVLGGNMSSRLFQEIRDKRGLAYSVYSFMTSHVDTGMFGVYAGVTPVAVTQTIDLIVQDLKKIMTEPVSTTELKDSKEYTKGNLCLSTESVDNQMVRLAQNEIHFGEYIPMQSVMDNIEAVTVEEVQNLAAELFKPKQASLTVLGPMKKNINLNKLISF